MAADTRDDFKAIFETSLQCVLPEESFVLSSFWKGCFCQSSYGLWQKSNISTVTSGCGRDVDKASESFRFECEYEYEYEF